MIPQPSVCLVDQNLTKSVTGRLSEVQRAKSCMPAQKNAGAERVFDFHMPLFIYVKINIVV